MKNSQITLRGSTALFALVLAGATAATPAFAQTTPTPTPSTTVPATQDNSSQDEGTIVVTGSMFQSAAGAATPSPVTVVTAENLDKRGISTVQDAIQSLASNNGPALTNSFSANGAFAAGASAVSLRGLSTNSTLVLFDGLRAAYYPLADDGSRNFVDLNTIPDDIIERIEVLRDGASSTYGADAIAGVVNIITKKEVKGFSARAEAGISDRGDAPSYRLTASAGTGDLDEDGYNAYLSGFWYKSEALMNKDRAYPYNSDDQTGICFEGHCGGTAVRNNISPSTGQVVLSTGANFMVRPYDITNTTTPAGSRYQNLSGCGIGTLVNLTAAQQTATSPSSVCQYDATNLWGTITPNIERFGVSGRVTARLGDTIEAYAEVNFMQSSVDYTGFPATIYGTAPTGIYGPTFSTSSNTVPPRAAGSGILALPVYVCPRANGASATMVNGVPTVPGCTAANGTLNPNNPFAAAGQVARLIGMDTSEVTYNATRNRAYRGALGITGNLSDNITFNVGATAMHTDLRRTQDGYVYIQHLLDVIADGTYNFRNPSATPQSVRDYLTPVNVVNASSEQFQFQASLSAAVVDLPGGPLQIGVGGSIRYEGVDAPSGNSDINGPTQRYFTLNAFGTSGNRTISSAFAELDAPITEWIGLNASGRYDRYSSGQDAFSPKVGLKVTPIKQLVLRGTYSRGFRIPSFGEANALPTTGYVTPSSSAFTNAYLAQYGAACTVANFAAGCPAYVKQSYGLTTLASPNLKPEKSRSFTAGAIFEPMRGISFTVDYYNIKKTGAITSPDTGSALQAYYAGTAIDPTIRVIADAPDINNPTAKPRVAFIESTLINADTINSEGLDFTASADVKVTEGFRISTSLEASYILKLSTIVAGHEERYDGTLGNFNLTAGSGTPKWHGSWLTTFDFGSLQLNGTVNYFGGYNLSAMDQGDDYKDCGSSLGITPCDVSSYVTFDMSVRYKVNDKFSIYGVMNNVFDRMPPIDPVTYGANNYNPVQGGQGILGRYLKAGVRVNF
ncbi:iron complex outermembrane receptor protein [Sphingomonas kyeonggiensis]|uniref:Iron complex outermembrane receptor protein n=1 Tax=Sphingomonas kyeonggiensis TaxID=1268553 RepID=A0A7W7JZV1_9SPHN|nr:TonB-dependent receptor [Sphingomonas kyeonggiensis]MBB4838329.1 iron complex outermembrane receptor protein [Sphingomonas kyeonggiensis]